MTRLVWTWTAALLLLAAPGCDEAPQAPGPDAAEPPAAPAVALEPSASFDSAMAPVLDSYVQVQEALAHDRLADALAPCDRLRAALRTAAAAAKELRGWAAPDVQAQLRVATEATTTLSQAKDLETAREDFRTLSKALIMWAKHRRPEGYDLVWCSMKQAGWLQRQGPVRNPYHGRAMLECGEKV